MNIHESVHLNSAAYDYWVKDRDMRPNNDINWPFNLVEDEVKKKYDIVFVDEKGNTISSQRLEEGTPISAPVAPSKPGFTFIDWIPTVPMTVGKSNMRFTPKYRINIRPKEEKPKFTIKRKD